MATPKRLHHMRPSIPAEPAASSEPVADPRGHLPALRIALLQQRRFRMEQLADLRCVVPVDQVQEEVTEALRHGARIALAGIDTALLRMDQGTYGSCVRCDARIPIERLEILPHTRFCAPCRSAGR